VEEIYPEPSTLTLDFGALDKVMEGKYRPGHFSGVGLIVAKLFHIVAPDNAYFGQKDWQQFAVINKLVQDLNFDTTLHSVSTLRDADGLAMSSRNMRLNAEERQAATIFFRALSTARTALLSGKNFPEAKRMVESLFGEVPRVALEYLELADASNLKLINHVTESSRPILCIAGYVGEVRLIDNMFVSENV